MSIHYERPVGVKQRLESFSGREVGVTSPTNPGYLRIADNGDIHLLAERDLGIIISRAKRTIFLVGNCVKLLTNDYEGFKWNNKAFNYSATVYSEPALIETKLDQTDIFDEIDKYVGT